MPFGSRFGKLGQWWADKSRLEKILMVIATISAVLIIILLFRPHSQSQEIGCKTTACLKESMRILEHVNVSLNPCEDVYNFACGKDREADEAISVEGLGKELLHDAYKEPIRYYEHKMVKAVKQLYQTCIDEEQIERDGLKTIKEVLKALGGWPVVEGSGWDEASFDWLQASYKARQLGYYHSMFLEIITATDPDDAKKEMLKVSSTNFRDHRHNVYNSDKVELMKEVVVLFGADNKTDITSELENIRQFQEKLEKLCHPHYLSNSDENAFQKFTVDDYQQRCRSIDWLQFINNIIGPSNQISKNEFVLFPPPQNLSNWLDLVSNTPKRTLANYMMWGIVTDTIPFLTKSLQIGKKVGFMKSEHREELCLAITQYRFFPDPISIMVARKHVPKTKNQLIEKLLVDVKMEVLEMISQIDWMENNDKQTVLNRTKALKFIVGLPGEYWDDTILDDIAVDMMEVKTVNFLNMLAQATRNHVTTMFSEIKKPMDHYKSSLLYIWSFTHSPSYSEFLNMFFVPVAAAGSSFFDQNRPHFLNYGTMGSMASYYLSQIVISPPSDSSLDLNLGFSWSSKTKEALTEKLSCFTKDFPNGNQMAHISVAQKLAYGAYEKWTKKNGKESKLLGVDYTPRQLFWISAANTLCQSGLGPRFNWKYSPNRRINATTFSTFSRYNDNFEKDFNCPAGSQSNRLEVCHLF